MGCRLSISFSARSSVPYCSSGASAALLHSNASSCSRHASGGLLGTAIDGPLVDGASDAVESDDAEAGHEDGGGGGGGGGADATADAPTVTVAVLPAMRGRTARAPLPGGRVRPRPSGSSTDVSTAMRRLVHADATDGSSCVATAIARLASEGEDDIEKQVRYAATVIHARMAASGVDIVFNPNYFRHTPSMLAAAARRASASHSVSPR